MRSRPSSTRRRSACPADPARARLRLAIVAGALAAASSSAAPAAADDAPGTSVPATPSATTAASVAPSTTSDPVAPHARPPRGTARPPPLHLEYAQYGVAIAMEFDLGSGRACPERTLALDRSRAAAPTVVAAKPCILGSGGGLVVRAGYRTPGPWYVGGAYEFVRMDSSNLYRLGIFQQLRAEIRYLPDIGYRVAPYVTTGLGAFAYGNEWGAETGGAIGFVGAGLEAEVSRVALLGLGLVYRPALIAGWTDTADQRRSTSLVHFMGLELMLEIRSEIGRRSAAIRPVASVRGAAEGRSEHEAPASHPKTTEKP